MLYRCLVKMLVVSAAVLLTCPRLTAAAADPELAKCATIENSVERLSCFDRLAKKITPPTGSPPATPVKSGKWESFTKTDPLDDKPIYTTFLNATSGKSPFGKPVTLVIRCHKNKTEMFVVWNSFLGTDTARITYRIDKQPAITSTWFLSTDHEASFFPSSPIPTLKSLATSTSFIAVITPYGENQIVAVFQTQGADNALADIRKGCHW